MEILATKNNYFYYIYLYIYILFSCTDVVDEAKLPPSD